ncbi:WxL domain-containing protein [Companilactobacillus sp. HBUAS56257]|jgi:hypothetical protein|uniref:WxL domain-containing protein n=1 Tax=Companilactobacillus sp. HBUAS56257 TaxID=3109360 RepID=UPI002FF2BCED
MKLSKSVLAGSLATAGIVLGAIAPAVTAQAATASGNQKSDGSVEYQDPSTSVGELGGKDSKLAIAFDELAEDGTVKTVGQAAAQSNANVTVQSGLLTLDAVPDFGFANAAEGTTVALDNNDVNGNAATDSQGLGNLTVTDSRSTVPGFEVNAAITKFSPVGGPTDGSKDKVYTLNLKPTELKNDKGESVAAAGTLKTEEANIAGGDAASTVMNLAAESYAQGPINASFTKADDDAFLTLGDTAGSDTKTTTSYNATITWTLKAAPKVNA